MYSREDTFRRKFESAANELGVQPNQVVSLKVRENVHTSEYIEFLEFLKREMGLNYSEVSGNLQGKGYLVSDRKARVIIVEHETGLEILYIVGSIASIIDLVPRIIQVWRFLRNHLRGRHDVPFRGIEIRRFDQNGKFSEEHISDLEMNSIMPMGFMNTAFTSITHLLENEMSDLISQVQSLTIRVEKLEKRFKTKTNKGKKKVTGNKIPPH